MVGIARTQKTDYSVDHRIMTLTLESNETLTPLARANGSCLSKIVRMISFAEVADDRCLV